MPDGCVDVMPPPPTLVAVPVRAAQAGGPVPPVWHAPLLPAAWNVSTDAPVLEVPITIVPVPDGLLPGSTTVTSTVNVCPVSLITKPDVGDRSRLGTTAPTSTIGAPVMLKALLV